VILDLKFLYELAATIGGLQIHRTTRPRNPENVSILQEELRLAARPGEAF